jgi:cytochrome P450
MTEPTHREDPPAFPMARTCPFDPASQYAELRAERPISRIELPTGQRPWLITRYEHVRKLAADPRISSDRSHPNFPLPAPPVSRSQTRNLNKALIGLDPPDHNAARRMVAAEFTVKRVQSLRPRIQQIVDGCIDELIAAGPGSDLVRHLSLPVPSLVICELLGVPYADREFFQSRSGRLLRGTLSPDERAESARELTDYLGTLVTAKEREPADDLLGRLIVRNRETRVLDHDLLVGMALLLLIAGHETTANMISLGTVGLLENPGPLAELKAGPHLVGTTVEELLRYFTIVDALFRVAVEDIDIDGVTIRAGEGVVLGLGSANRDAEVFGDADELDIHRGAQHHVSFAYGIHQCLGQHLARTELEIVFGTLFARLPDLGLAVPARELPYKNDAIIYGVYEVPVTWSTTSP